MVNLFGSKCLPDEAASEIASEIASERDCFDAYKDSLRKPAEPKFKVDDKVQVNKKGDPWRGAIGEIIDISDNGSCYVLFPHGQAWFRNVDLEPYTEPTDHIGKNSEKVDRIIKDGFRDHNRLHITAMAMQGILSNSNPQMVDMPIDRVVQLADAMASMLIAECEKGGSK